MGYMLKFRSPNLYTIIIATKIKKDLLKKKRKFKGFLHFYYYYFYYHYSNKLNLTTGRKSPANEVVVRLLSFFIV